MSSSARSPDRQLHTDVEAICLPKGRKVGSPGHKKVHKYIVSRLEEIGCVPFQGDSFELSDQKGSTSFYNLVGIIRGSDPELPPLLVGAHYDSVIAAPCADDNAAAVAIALGVAERIANHEPTGSLGRDLIVAIFVAEEPPHFRCSIMGSQRFWHEQLDGRPIHAASIMDMVGHDVSIPGSMLGQIPGIGGLLDKIPGLANRDIPLPWLHPLVFVAGSESHPEMAGTLEAAGVAKGLKL
ncbi:MAG: M28 family peptidase, partial [Verrucomicrobiota bacterium]